MAVVVGWAFTMAPSAPAAEASPSTQRTAVVPFEDLDLLLETGPRRVWMEREEFERLQIEAAKEAEADPPRTAVWVGADYRIEVGDERAEIRGALTVESLAAGVHAVDLPLGGVGVREIGGGLPWGRTGRGNLVLLVTEPGLHEVTLHAVAPIQTTAARQILRARLPVPPVHRLRLIVPGDVDLKAGAAVLSRTFAPDANETRFELLAEKDRELNLVMSLNSRLKRKDRIVVARSVLVDQVTRGGENILATVSFDILHRAVDRLTFALPAGVELTSVSSPKLASWQVMREEDDRAVLDVRLQEETTGRVVLHLAAFRAWTPGEPWTFPRIEPLEVAGHTALVGLTADERLTTQNLHVERLVPVDRGVLHQAMPAPEDAGRPLVPTRPVAAWYAPQPDFALRGEFVERPARFHVTAHTRLQIEESGLSAMGGFTVNPAEEPLFDVELMAPAAWDVTRVTDGEGTVFRLDAYPLDDGRQRLVVRLPRPVLPGAAATLLFHASTTPEGWLDEWTETEVEAPVFVCDHADRYHGALVLASSEELEIRPLELEGLIPLDAGRREAFGLSYEDRSLAYRYDEVPYRARLAVNRASPRLTAESFTFARLSPDTLEMTHEVVLQVEGARTRQVRFQLPTNTPDTVSIWGLRGTAVKEYTAESVGEGRPWRVRLAEAAVGSAHLAVSYTVPLDTTADLDQVVPEVRALDVAYQSGLVAVEGSPELDVTESEHPRAVDVGELAAAEYRPGKRLLGAYAWVGEPAPVRTQVSRRAPWGLPTVLVDRLDLTTTAAARGVAQTSARFTLRTRAPYLELHLPKRATLWSVLLDEKPLLPQEQDRRVLLSLPEAEPGVVRSLQVVYETPTRAFHGKGRLRVDAPELHLPAADIEVPVADLHWQLILPRSYRVVRGGGTLDRTQAPQPRLAAVQAARGLAWVAGGVEFDNGLIGLVLAPFRSAMQRSAAYEAAHRGVQVATEPAPVDREQMATFDDNMQVLGEAMMDFEEDARQQGEMKRLRKPAAPPPLPAPRKVAKQKSVGYRVKGGTDYVLEGKRSLAIRIEAQGRTEGYRSLGVAPRLDVSVVSRRRMEAWITLIGFAVFVGGVLLTGASKRTKAFYVVGIMLAGTVLGALPGLLHWTDQFNAAFFAACFLVVYFLGVGILRWVWRGVLRFGRWLVPLGATAGLLMCCGGGVLAEEPDDRRPVTVPDDILVAPYDPQGEGLSPPPHLLVPYDLYQDLWDRAHPDAVLEPEPPALPYGWHSVRYRAELGEGDILTVSGQLQVEIHTDQPVDLHLPLAGLSLGRALLDGRPAAIQFMDLPPPLENPPMQMRQAAAPQRERPAPLRAASLRVAGKGRHTLTLEAQVPLHRRGGWRMAEARLPGWPVATVALQVPRAQTEVTVRKVADRSTYVTTREGETITTVLGEEGMFEIQWRPKVHEGQMEAGLTATSFGVFDIGEADLRLSWDLTIRFRQGERDAFEVLIPAGYQVEAVHGENIRGWEQEAREDGIRLRVETLKAAREQEHFGIVLRADGVGLGHAVRRVTAPAVDVVGAVRQTGRLMVRRSPLLELRVADDDRIERVNLVQADHTRAAAVELPISPLGVEPFQVYEFVGLGYRLGYDVAPYPHDVEAALQTIVRLGEQETALESRIALTARRRPVYLVEVRLPGDLVVDEVTAPGEADWDAHPEEDGQRLVVRFAAGRQGTIPILVRGTVDREEGAVAPLPRIVVQDADAQRGEIAVQAEPGVDVEPRDLVHLERVLLDRLYGWLQAPQRATTRLAFRYDRPDIGGVIAVIPRSSRVSAFTVSNVRVTDRTVEETHLLHYQIAQAGLRQVSFLLPDALADARIRVPHLRRKSITPVPGQEQVRVSLWLQDAVQRELVVLVEHDRVLSAEEHVLRPPRIEEARVDARYFSLENAGRDELEVLETAGMTPLDRRRKEWKRVAEVLRGGSIQAFLAATDAEHPRLRFQPREREQVETAGARIGLARTTVFLDEQGAFRANLVLHVDNRTEPFLAVALPKRARLWTARVAGEYVKPVIPAGGGKRNVLIPLIKTEAGDLDYQVELKYGGALPPVRSLRGVGFPLLGIGNIGIELSQLEIHVPRRWEWFRFRGTMRQVEKAGDFEAGVLSYQNKMLKRLVSSLKYGTEFEKARAGKNIKQLQETQARLTDEAPALFTRNVRFQQEAGEAQKLVTEAENELAVAATSLTAGVDNRANFNTLYDRQVNAFAFQAEEDGYGNWDAGAVVSGGEVAVDRQAKDNFRNPGWLVANGLVEMAPPAEEASKPDVDRAAWRESAGQQVELQMEGKELGKKLHSQLALLGQQQAQLGDAQVRGRSQSRRSQRDLAWQYKKELEDVVDFAAPSDAPVIAGSVLEGRQAVGRVAGVVRQERYVDSDGDERLLSRAAGQVQGLASLDIALPDQDSDRWRTVQFTTPRGDAKVVGYALSRRTVEGGRRLGLVVAVAAVAGLIAQRVRGVRIAPPRRVLIWNLVVILGLLGLLFGILPIAGLVAIILGLIQLRRERTAPPAPA